MTKRVINAWVRKRTARTSHFCRCCENWIWPKKPYLSITLSDQDTPSSEKLSVVHEHLDCQLPWYIAADRSPTHALSKIRRPRGEPKGSPERYESPSSEPTAGPVNWQATDIVHHLLSRQSPTMRAAAIGEIDHGLSVLVRAYTECLGDREKMRKLGSLIAEMEQVLGHTPDTSRHEKIYQDKKREAQA